MVAEWLRRQTANLLGYALAGSNPVDVVVLFFLNKKYFIKIIT